MTDCVFRLFTALGSPFFSGAPELWPPPLAYSGAAAAAAAAAAELPGGLQAPTLVHPALHPHQQVPLRSFL